jgi:hypothetical protein
MHGLWQENHFTLTNANAFLHSLNLVIALTAVSNKFASMVPAMVEVLIREYGAGKDTYTTSPTLVSKIAQLAQLVWWILVGVATFSDSEVCIAFFPHTCGLCRDLSPPSPSFPADLARTQHRSYSWVSTKGVSANAIHINNLTNVWINQDSLCSSINCNRSLIQNAEFFPH